MKVITHVGMGSVKPGEEVDLPEKEAIDLLRQGVVHLPKPRAKAPAKSEVDESKDEATDEPKTKSKEKGVE